MKKSIVFVLTALFGLSLAAANITIADGAKSAYTIVIPDGSGDKYIDNYIKLGGEFIQHTVKKATGARLQIVKESAFNGKTPAIFVGNTKALKKAGFTSEKFDFWEHAIAVKNKNVYIYGRDIPSPFSNNKSHSHTMLGTLKGVTTFAEKFVNTRVMHYRKYSDSIHPGIVTYPQKKIVLSDKYFYRNRPQFMSTTGASLGLWYDIANNWVPYGGIKLNAHSHATAIPQAKYYKTNPEFFALINGKRYFCPGGRQPHYCLSNKKVQELIYQELLSRAKTGAHLVEVGASDGFKPCECKECEAWYNTKEWSEKLWCFHRDLAARLYKDSPKTKVSIMCYGNTQVLPKTFKKFPSPNVVIDVAPPAKKILERWKKFNIQGIISWTYFFGCYKANGFSPALDFDTLQKCAASLYGYNIRGIYNCGQFSAPSLEGPWYYAYGKWLGDKNIPADTLLTEYCLYTFGPKAGPAFKAFFKYLDSRLKAEKLPNPVRDDWSQLEALANLRVLTIPFWQKRYPAEAMKELDRLFFKAVALCDPKTPELAPLKIEYEYLRRAAAICNAKKVYDANPTDANFSRMLDAVAARNNFLATLPENPKRPGYIDRKKCYNWTKLTVLKDGGYMRGRFGSVFEVDAALARSARRSGEAVKVKDFKDTAWAKAESWTLRPKSRGTKEIAASFKVGFNDKGLLFKLSTIADSVADGVKIKRDGTAWYYPSFDISFFADPNGKGRHIIFNFQSVSKYDSEVHFDAAGKLKENPKWNGSWSHVSRRKGPVWEADLFIPFSDFGADIVKQKKVYMQIGYSADSQKGHYTWNQPLDGNFVSRTGLGTITLGKNQPQKVEVKEYMLSDDFGKGKRLPKYWLAYPSGKLKYHFDGKVLVFGGTNKHGYPSVKKRDPAFRFASANDKVTMTIKVSGKGNIAMGAGLYDKKKWVINRGRQGGIKLTDKPQEYSFTFGPDADFLRGVETFIPSILVRGIGEVRVYEFKVRHEKKY